MTIVAIATKHGIEVPQSSGDKVVLCTIRPGIANGGNGSAQIAVRSLDSASDRLLIGEAVDETTAADRSLGGGH